ncbi:HET-domain-containing protein [Podospora aff. communis PSN243]|uniref:HET-domain-containing protein n=1 Tax=Podospora aff. communis PSN243 TaxID=3040156 RepID=A0AAV9G589_9PEZI|nr:HET-domain-containing protein [Podospora aff. communis PSN243]
MYPSVKLCLAAGLMGRHMPLHSALNGAGSEIRVLDLLPGETNAPLHCKLQHASLSDKPQFEALSYVWGDATIRSTITVDGHNVGITVNLEETLRALRYHDKTRTLWVDAICINQQDTAEKNVQVPLMGNIYHNAVRVVTWLGPLNPAVELAVSYAKAHEEKGATTTPRDQHWQNLRDEAHVVAEKRKPFLLQLLRVVEGQEALWDLRYWTRMWTFQEYYLARDEPLCRCGRLEFGHSSISQFRGDLLFDAHELRQEWDVVWDEAEWQWIGRLVQLVQRRRAVAAAFMRPNPRVDNMPLWFLLYFTADRNSSDARDKIYALYGILHHEGRGKHLPLPDYSKPVNLVRLEILAFIMHHEQTWDPFKVFQLADAAADDENQPSWLLDFNSKLPVPPASRWPLQPFENGIHGHQTVSDDLTVLSFSASHLGPLRLLMALADTALGVLQQIRDFLEIDAAPGNPSDQAGGTLLLGYCATLHRSL